MYVISLCDDPRSVTVMPAAPIDADKINAWIKRVPALSLHDVEQPPAAAVMAFLNSFWLADETIVYIGKDKRLRTRLKQYYGHQLGERKPHAGGHWLKTLTNPDALFIHYAVVDHEAEALVHEDCALTLFKSQVSSRHRVRLHNPIPFANRATPTATANNRTSATTCSADTRVGH